MSFLKAGGPVAAPSPTPSNSSSGKRKRHETTEVYSQPASTGIGHESITRALHTEKYLKEKDRALKLEEILSYLSLPADTTQGEINELIRFLQRSPHIDYDPTGFSGVGSYKYRPTHPVRNSEELKAYLQKKKDALGLSVKELKDGWPDAVEAVNAMAARGELIITRQKKDQVPKMVWLDDSTIREKVTPDLQMAWDRIPIPNTTEELRKKLLNANLTPASEAAVVFKAPKSDKKPKKRQAGKRQTNMHMKNILKDYSHLRPG